MRLTAYQSKLIDQGGVERLALTLQSAYMWQAFRIQQRNRVSGFYFKATA